MSRYKRKDPINVPESRRLKVALDRIIFGSGVDLALHAKQGRINRNYRESLIP
jgi:hypothetical protein